MRICLSALALSLASCVYGIERPPGSPESEAESIQPLLLQLGDDAYAVRQAAFEALLQRPAARALKPPYATDDPEVLRKLQDLRLAFDLDGDKPSLRRLIHAAWPKLFGATEPGLGTQPLRSGEPAPGAEPPAMPQPEPASRESRGRRSGSHATPSNAEGASGWLAATQEADGHWDARRWGAQEDGDFELTALAQMALLAARGPDAAALKAQQWLLSRLDKEGYFTLEGGRRAAGLAHALAVWSCVDCAGLKKDAQAWFTRLDPALQVLTRSLLPAADADAQTRLLPPAAQLDLFTAFFAAGALHAARRWGHPVDPQVFEAQNARLAQLFDAPTRSYRVADGHAPSAWATVLGCAVERMCAHAPGDTRGDLGAALTQVTPAFDSAPNRDAWMEFVCSYAAFREGGEVWKAWNEALKSRAERTWVREGRFLAARPMGEWRNGGRVCSTALYLLSSSIYVRTLNSSITTSWQRLWCELPAADRPGRSAAPPPVAP